MGGGGSKVMPYSLGTERFSTDKQFLKIKLYDATRIADGAEFSVLSFSSDSTEISKALAQNAVKSWRVFRHPIIPQFIDTYAENEVTYVVTERIMPFSDENLSDNELCWALHNLATFAQFISESSKFIHGNLLKSSLFLTPGHELKVLGLQWLSSAQSGPIISYTSEWRSILPFEISADPSSSDPYSIDCRFVGEFIQSWSTRLPRSISKFAKLWTSSEISQPPSKFLSIDYWDSDKFVQYITFMEQLAIRDPFEREIFFKNLPENSSSFSEETQTHTLLPHLISALSFAPSPTLLAPILTIGRKLTEKKFAEVIVPPLVSLFENKDKTLRVHLLSQIDALVPFLDKNVVNSQIFPNISGGLSDPSSQLKQATIVASVPLAQFMSRDNMHCLLRELRRLQVDADAQIRANSVICVAKIADFIEADSRISILCQSFSKAAIDPFAPCRRAAIAAYRNSIGFFNAVVIATNVMTSISPLCVDQNEEVRSAAMKAMQYFLDFLSGKSKPEENKKKEQSTEEVTTHTDSNTKQQIIVKAIQETENGEEEEELQNNEKKQIQKMEKKKIKRATSNVASAEKEDESRKIDSSMVQRSKSAVEKTSSAAGTSRATETSENQKTEHNKDVQILTGKQQRDTEKEKGNEINVRKTGAKIIDQKAAKKSEEPRIEEEEDENELNVRRVEPKKLEQKALKKRDEKQMKEEEEENEAQNGKSNKPGIMLKKVVASDKGSPRKLEQPNSEHQMRATASQPNKGTEPWEDVNWEEEEDGWNLSN